MQTPGPISKRRSTSAADVAILHRSILIFLCGVLAACSWLSARAEIPPIPPDPFKVIEHGSGVTWTYVTLEDGDIGSIDLDEIREGNVTSVVELLQEHGEWTGVDEDYELLLFGGVRDGYIVFTQLVHGMRVSPGSSIYFDQHGNVTRLQTTVVHPEAVDNLPSILEQDAVALGNEALRNFLAQSDAQAAISGFPSPSPTGRGPILLIRPHDLDDPPRIYWRLNFQSADGGRYRVYVDAHSGDTQIRVVGGTGER